MFEVWYDVLGLQKLNSLKYSLALILILQVYDVIKLEWHLLNINMTSIATDAPIIPKTGSEETVLVIPNRRNHGWGQRKYILWWWHDVKTFSTLRAYLRGIPITGVFSSHSASSEEIWCFRCRTSEQTSEESGVVGDSKRHDAHGTSM